MGKSSFLQDFKAFAMRGNVIDMAVGVIIGGAFGKIVSSIVADVIIPLAPVVPHFLRPGGTFLCSGILNVRLPEVLAALRAAGFTITAENQLDDWCQLTASL